MLTTTAGRTEEPGDDLPDEMPPARLLLPHAGEILCSKSIEKVKPLITGV